MNCDLSLLQRSPLFRGVGAEDLAAMLQCLAPREVRKKRGEFLFYAGDTVRELGLVLSGEVLILTEDHWGNRNILSSAGPGDLFGEVFACAPARPVPVSVEAAQDTAVLLVDAEKVLAPCCNACPFHQSLIHNLFQIVAEKNLMLTQKMVHLTRRSTREKLLSYLSICSLQAGSSTFTIPFNRQEMADYLSVDRSAMSKELCKLRDEGLLRFEKNKFQLLD